PADRPPRARAAHDRGRVLRRDLDPLGQAAHGHGDRRGPLRAARAGPRDARRHHPQLSQRAHGARGVLRFAGRDAGGGAEAAAVRRLRAAAALLAVVWLLWPSPIDPIAYQPPAKPALAGPWAPNDALSHARLLGRGQLRGPEDVALDAQGRVYCGTAN